MQRSPKASLAVLFIVMLGIAGLAQNNPATPKAGSGVPQTTVPSTAPSQPPAAPLPDTAPSTATQPTVDQPKSAEQPQDQPAASDQKKSDAEANPPVPKSAQQKAADQRAVEQKKSDTNTGGAALPTATATPVPQAQPKTDILDSSATSGALVTDEPLLRWLAA
jgi:outer membrane biosynthesis protein TonB